MANLKGDGGWGNPQFAMILTQEFCFEILPGTLKLTAFFAPENGWDWKTRPSFFGMAYVQGFCC